MKQTKRGRRNAFASELLMPDYLLMPRHANNKSLAHRSLDDGLHFGEAGFGHGQGILGPIFAVE